MHRTIATLIAVFACGLAAPAVHPQSLPANPASRTRGDGKDHSGTAGGDGGGHGHLAICGSSEGQAYRQAGTNCQLSAHSGLPALTVPTGFTDDGLWIHRGDEQKPGATIHQLFAGSGAALPVAVILSNVDREALREGKLVGRVYSGQSIGAVQNIKLVLPAQ